MLVLKLARQSCSPANAAVGAGHIRNRRAGRGSLESSRLRDHISDLITTPTVALNSDRLLIDKALVYNRLNRWQNTSECALTRMPDGVNDIRHQYQVAVACVVRGIDRMARPRVHETMQSFRQRLVDVHNHR